MVNISPAGYISKFESYTALPPIYEGVITEMINNLIPLEEDRFLILDNYQIIREIEIHAIVANLIDYLPPNIYLIIASQSNPPLQIPRFRV